MEITPKVIKRFENSTLLPSLWNSRSHQTQLSLVASIEKFRCSKIERTKKWQEDLGCWAIKRSRWWFRSDGCDENIGAFTICLESFPRRFESPNTHTQSYIVLFICICFKCYYIIVFDQSFLVFMTKIQKHIKSRKSIKFDQHCCVLSQAYFALYLCTNGLCIYECNLFPMHSYHCGRNLDICVIVVNRSSNLPWIISQWIFWSWDMHIHVPIYFPTLLFYCFFLRAQ